MPEPDFTDITTHERVPLPPRSSPVNLRQAFVFMAVFALTLLLFEGESLRTSGEKLKPGWQRTMVLLVGEPAGWVARNTHAHDAKQHLVAWARPSGTSGAAAGEQSGPRGSGALGAILVTGDSMSQPLDSELARAFTAAKSKASVIRDPRLGTSISQPELLDWTVAAREGASKSKPDAVVVLLGANEGFPFSTGGGVECCGQPWVDEYSRRVGVMMDSWSRSDAARVYWLTLPTPRDKDRKEISDAVNRAILIAARKRPESVRVVDLVPSLTPGNQFRAAMQIGERQTIVREPDGVHLNKAGSYVALRAVLKAMQRDFGALVPR